jgi:thymidylate synthase (FAD)
MAPLKSFIADGVGFVELLEVFGDDLTVVNAARVSFAKESHELSEADKKLIRYLARNGHISPFFHPQIRFRLKMPIFVAREWFRHTIGLSRNEVSRRYVDSAPECWLPVEGLRARDPKLKQGSKAELIGDATTVLSEVEEFQRKAMEFYQSLLDRQVAPEVARGVLPQSMYTEFIETGSLSAYARICQLRLDPHAQKEIRDYANMVADAMAAAFPVSWPELMSATSWTPPGGTNGSSLAPLIPCPPPSGSSSSPVPPSAAALGTSNVHSGSSSSPVAPPQSQAMATGIPVMWSELMKTNYSENGRPASPKPTTETSGTPVTWPEYMSGEYCEQTSILRQPNDPPIIPSKETSVPPPSLATTPNSSISPSSSPTERSFENHWGC